MRKGILLLAIALLFLAPSAARAQAAAAFDQLTIQLWPEYDRSAVLAIYEFSVSPETPLPASITLKMPAGAELLAVARQESGGLMNLEYELPEQVGDFQPIRFSVTDRSSYHLEFYFPYTRQGQKRNFLYSWPGDYAVTTLKISIQEPVGATNVTTDPAMTLAGPAEDGFTYHSISTKNASAGNILTFNFSYDKSDDALSSTSRGVQPTAPLDQPISGQSSYTVFLPWIFGGLGVVLIAGGGFWYWLSGRASGGGSGSSRKRHASRAAEEAGAEIYCTGCGKRAQSNDRFCRACGTRLRTRE